MVKRLFISLIILFILAIFAIHSLYQISSNETYLEAASLQKERKITYKYARNIIYDRNLNRLTEAKNKTYTLITPDLISINKIKDIVLEEIDTEKILKENRPELIEIKENAEIDTIKISERYEENQVASNVLGYLENGVGAAAIEKYGENILKDGGELSVIYEADSIGGLIDGQNLEIINTLNKEKGIVLTIDKNLQSFAEEKGKILDEGAIVILSVPDAEILAMASFPLLDSSCPEKYIDSDSSYFVDKTLSVYPLGSVFKLSITTAALNEKIESFSVLNFKYNCTGAISSDGMNFTCFGSYPHCEVDLNLAIAKSCNCYFMNLSKLISKTSLISTALNLGLGSKTEIFPGFFTEKGTLPNENSLNSNRALSNFAIGQGEVSASPIDVAAMINTIASRGIYKSPTLYKGITESEEYITDEAEIRKGARSIKVSDSILLENYMASAVKYGTAKKGDSEYYKAFAKTGTAQTGKFENGKELVNYWYAGFIENEEKERYVIIVLNIDANENDNPTGEIFKSIGEYLCGYN